MSQTTKMGKSRTVEEAVAYAVANRIRVEVLSALNERGYSAVELSRIVRQPLSTVTHHIEELLRSKSIEVAATRQVKNITQSIYRAVAMPFYSDQDMEALDPEARKEIYGLILQNAMAEALASLWAGKISDDPRARLMWRWFNVDEEGRRDIADELERSWIRVTEIEAEAAQRRARSGEEATPMIVTVLGYERSRTPVPGDS